MSEQHNNDHEEMLRLMRENSVLIQENNKLLHKLYRHSILGFTVKVIWFAVIIGLPFAVYFYFLGPYIDAFGANYEQIMEGLGNFQGLKALSPLFEI